LIYITVLSVIFSARCGICLFRQICLSRLGQLLFLAECYYLTFGLWYKPSVCRSVCNIVAR